MNMYLVQTVSSRPRPWSSYTNINSKEPPPPPARMNSAEEISKYHDHNSHYCSPVLARRTTSTTYNLPEKSPKKDKKWSLGSLFRRKKKPGSESSSEEENDGKGFLQKKNKKKKPRKRTNQTLGFDHVVVPQASRHPTLTNGYKSHEDSIGILSEPSFRPAKNFIPASDFTSRLVTLKDNQDGLDRNGLTRSNNSLGSPSIGSLGRRKKDKAKARVATRPTKGEDSSDDDSQLSAFRSDESLTRPRDGSLSRKSRAARTQRYLKRRSKDEEIRDPLRLCKSDVEHHEHSRNVQHVRSPDERMQNMKFASKSPILSATPKSKLWYANSAPPSRPNFSGLSTIPPSHSSHSKHKTVNSTNGSSSAHHTHKQSSSFHDYTGNKCLSADLDVQRSLSCDANIHKAPPSPDNEPSEVVHVQFPLGKPFNRRPNLTINQHLNSAKKHPPPPPPRDPRRILTVQNSDGRPISYSFENGYQPKTNSDQQLNKPQPLPEPTSSLNPNCRSTSEDHISLQPSQRVPVLPRPSSATPEANRLHKLAKTCVQNDEHPNGYRYLTDKHPRSRKPICIQPCGNQVEKLDQQNPKPFDFWRQKDEETRWTTKKSTPGSPIMFTAQTHVRTNIFLPNGVTVETDPHANSSQRPGSPFRPITPTTTKSATNGAQPEPSTNGSVVDDELMQRKSSNLEDALDELEAIYNSLHLGDEDLLERAEQREAEAAQKRRDAIFESFPNSVARGALSDSSFRYDPNFDSTRRKKYLKRGEPDRKADDMAFRKLNKDRYNTISDPQSVVNRVSYLLTSPVFSTPVDESSGLGSKATSNEPDVTFDDVVYRNVKHTNNSLKVVEPQPPFGIPIGPILPASNSDYLHATPEVSQKFTIKSRKIPDVVKDDLAYRNLRKDPSKEPALPQSNCSPEDYINNNSNNNGKTGEALKKKRAVRSLSANIFNLMQKEWKSNGASSLNDDDDDCKSKDQKIGDVADALEVARQILKEKENKITATRKAFMSDGELKYRRYGRSSPTEQRLNFLNEMKSSRSLNNENVYHHKLQVNIPAMDYDRLEAKPPTPDRNRRGSRQSKESTPIPSSSSPSEEAQIKKQSTLDELLTSLAVEARETSERITNELKVYGEEKQKKKLLENGPDDESKQVKALRLQELEKDAISASLNLQLTEADSTTSDHAKLCGKLLECVVEGATTKIEPESSEELDGDTIEPLLPEMVANVVLIPSDKSKLEVPVSTEVFSESDHDYVNVQSTDEAEKELTETEASKDVKSELVQEELSSTELDEEEKELLLLDDDSVSLDICLSPLERHKAELVAAFQELKHGTLEKKRRRRSIEQTDKGGGEECVSVEYIALPTTGCALAKESRFDFGNFVEEQTEPNFSSFGFDVGGSTAERGGHSGTNPELWINHDGFDSLKSPKLVRNLDTIVSECRNLLDDFEVNFGSRESNESRELFVGLEQCLKGFEQDFGATSENHDEGESKENLKINLRVLGQNSSCAPMDVRRANLGSFNPWDLNFDVWKNLNDKEPVVGEFDFGGSLGQNGELVLPTQSDPKILPWGLNLDVGENLNDKEANVDELDFGGTLDQNPGLVLPSQSDPKTLPWGLNFDEGINLNDTGPNVNELDFGGSFDQNLQLILPSQPDSKTLTNSEDDSKNVDLAPSSPSSSSDTSDHDPKSTLNQNFSRFSDSGQTKSHTYEDGFGRSSVASGMRGGKVNSSDLVPFSRDSRHTLDETRSSRSWYDEPAVIALACSCGIACTSQLPSFDIVFVLGLLFAIISLLIALIART